MSTIAKVAGNVIVLTLVVIGALEVYDTIMDWRDRAEKRVG